MKNKWRIAIIFFFLLILVQWKIINFITNMKEESFVPHEEEIEAKDDDFLTLPTIENNKIFAVQSRNESHRIIHFLEGHGHSSLSIRVWCAIESACNNNPNALIILHMRSKRLLVTNAARKVLKSYENFRVVTLNEEKLFMGSSLERFYLEKQWVKSKWPISHYNDALRYCHVNIWLI